MLRYFVSLLLVSLLAVVLSFGLATVSWIWDAEFWVRTYLTCAVVSVTTFLVSLLAIVLHRVSHSEAK